MRILAVLWAIALLGAGLGGICTAGGRNNLVRKRAYYIRHFFGAIACCQGCLMLLAGLFLLIYGREPWAWAQVSLAGEACLPVFGFFALAVLGTFACYAIPNLEIRALTTVAVFGPLSLFRPWVIALGAALAINAAPTPPVLLAFLPMALLMILQTRKPPGWPFLPRRNR